MITIANSVASKLAVAFVATAMMFSLVAPAQAATNEELEATIADLMAKITALTAQMGVTTGSDMSSASVCPYTWTRSLNVGDTGADVMALQQYLNATAATQVAASGAGSAGNETSFYGDATGAAVMKFQEMYRAEILSPLNLVNSTTFFGNSTRAQANALCVAATVVETEEGEEAEEGETASVTLSGEASLESFEIDSASDDEIEEGSEYQEVAELTVEFTDGDAEISRLDVKFVQGSADAADAFDTISLWIDGEKVAEEDASDEDDYQNDEMTMRFSNLDIIAMEDEEVEIVVAVSTMNNLDASELGTWTVSVDSMRFFDADGVATTDLATEDIGSGSETFTIQVEGIDDEINVKTSSNDPDATTLEVEDDSKSDWYKVFVFDLDTDDSVNDIELDTMEVSVTVSSSTYNAIVDDVELVIDGVTIDDVSVSGGSSATAVLTFDVDEDVTITAGDRVAAELMLRFKSLDSGNEGVTVQGTVTSSNTLAIDAEGADDITDLSGAATGDAHTLRTTGIDTDLSADSAVVTTGDNANDDYATYELEVAVTAFEQDVFIDVNHATSIVFNLEDSAASSSVAGSRSVVLTSSADENAGYFEINEGETETITLTVTYTPGVSNTASRLVLNSVAFAETAVGPTQTQTTLPKTDYRTSVVTIVN